MCPLNKNRIARSVHAIIVPKIAAVIIKNIVQASS